MARKPAPPPDPSEFYFSLSGRFRIDDRGIRVVIEPPGYESDDIDVCWIPRAMIEAEWAKYAAGA